MAITNAQYDEIMRGYQQQQLHNRRLIQERIDEAHAKVPQLKFIQDEIASASVLAARKKLEGDTLGYQEAMDTITSLKKEKEALLKTSGFPQDYFEPIYTCRACKDTGYVDGEKCRCFKQKIINVVYSQSNINEILERENFSTFSYK